MRGGEPPQRGNLGRRLPWIASGIVAMLVAVLVVGPRLADSDPGPPPFQEPFPPERPIPHEAGVFALSPTELAVPPHLPGRPDARPRTMDAWRALRAYPGAPPRIPHPVSGEAQMGGTCGACHERGGFVPAYGAYAPVTPHPDYTSCLQCHVPDSPSAPFAPSDWQAPDWPALGERAMAGSPPRVPHVVQMRENCVACHAGPGALREIRTTHPERTGCLQCHVTSVPTEEVFTRPLDGRAASAGGGR